MTGSLRCSAIRTARLLGVLVACYGAFYAWLYLTGNIHPLTGGEAYRSAQLSAGQLEKLIDQKGIRSILNLRGGNYDKQWYQDEVSLARERGITHRDFPLSSKREVTRDQATALIAAMRTLPKPMLIHCEQGADRTGLASALYIAAIRQGSDREARAALSPRFGHFPYTIAGKDPMDVSYARLVTDLKLFPDSHAPSSKDPQ